MTENNDLSQEFIAAQRARLEALRAELLASEESSFDEATLLQEERGAEATEYEDAAQSLDRKEVLQAKHDVDLKRVANIERALQKIELGTYGISDVSGKVIPKARLEASPEAVLTVEEAGSRE
jgi:DnaK suppressor protein